MKCYTVILDACTLYPAPLRDLLLQLAAGRLFRAKWTDRIQDEWIRSLQQNRPDISFEQLNRTKILMERAVPDAVVAGYDYLIATIVLPDENDRHVLASAIHARADAIVTFNLKDFPEDILSLLNIEAIHPDDLIEYQHDLDEAAVILAAQTCRRRLKNPPLCVEEYLGTLRA
ncbi:MAG: PIN domain-containing protein [Alphaproteobacteria bacterium]